MASVITRLLAALRGSGIPSHGRETGMLESRVQPVRPRANANASPDAPVDRTTRIAGFRVKRLRQIAAFYADGAHEAVLTVGDCTFLPQEHFHAAAEMIVRTAGERASTLIATENAVRKAIIKRRLGEISDRERATLRAADLLCELGEFERAAALRIRLPIVWNEGRCHASAPGFESVTRRNFVRLGLEVLFGEFAVPQPELFNDLRRAWRNALSLDATLSEEEHQTLEAYQFVERSWLDASDVDNAPPTPAALTLGLFAGTDRPLIYDGTQSVVTFAPAASAKRGGQTALNLAQLAAGAVVVDIDAKAFQSTARGRQKDVGKVFAFAPALNERSMHYNPIDLVAQEPDNAWSEARLLADLLTGRRGPDEEGRAFIAPAIYDVALSDRPERRHMRGVLARVACSEKQLEGWTNTLARSPHPELARHAKVLREMATNKRHALIARLMPELAVWQTPPIADLIERSDWTPADLRHRATLYLCVDRHELDRYAVVLRVIVGQMLAALGRNKAVSPGTTVTFFLDELARLGPMGTVARAVDTGPDCGVRPWMFFADTAEMRATYPKADGMLANCAAHCYVEPDLDTAHELSLRLGFVKSLFGTEEKPMVAADDLTGPEFDDKIITLVRSRPPAKLVLPGELRTAQRRGR
ncbi:MAG TPA: type IV secretory system conjugative DNA transfer family protein [Xanthobacteraceae bacterium]|nr:type IV secretory system conjugative DNA transfer family protein [Xanthobacteraceae bacterium]